jgi:transcriptional regulator with XRE-family HTH domain
MKTKKPGPPKGRPKSGVKRSPLGERLCRARKARGLTQEELGKRVGVSKRMIAHYEVGSKAMTVPSLQRIAEALGVKVATLVANDQAATFDDERLMKPALKKRVEVLEQLPAADQQAIFRMIDNARSKFAKSASG